MSEKNKSLLKFGILILLLVWVGFLLARKIDLVTADLGRHLKNGEWLVESGFNFSEKHSPIYENFYSYTHPEFPVVNHHWASGLLFYFIWKFAGFFGLSAFYVALSLFTFLVVFLMAVDESNFTIATLSSFALAPLIAERVEIRPEIFSVFFPAIFFFILWKFTRDELGKGWLWLLPVSMAFWINLHVYFFLGFFLIGAFWLESLFKKNFSKARTFVIFGIFSILAALFNPAGYKGVIYPLFIFKNYEYTIVENKSVWFVENYGLKNPNFAVIKIVLVLLILSFALLYFVNRKKISPGIFLITLFFGLLGWFAIRNFSLLGFFAVPILSRNFFHAFQQKEGEINHAKENGVALLYIVLALTGIFGNYQYVAAHGREAGFGLRPGVEDAANFFLRENIRGPIFNNYDNGGYLIWKLDSKERVFVDNRPAEYPGEFFSKSYKPMQEDGAVWKDQEGIWDFNAIFFYWRDITPWAQSFLTRIVTDQEWVLVYRDDYAMIFLRQNEENRRIIENYQVRN